jgi:hypothetical protein
MSRKIIVLIAIAVILIIAGLLALKWVYKPVETSVASEKASTEITASDMISQFETNEQKANESYLGKVVIVSGTIEKIDDDSAAISITLKSPENISGVICSFSKSAVSRDDLVEGNQVRVKGKCDGYLLDVVLTKCSIVE